MKLISKVFLGSAIAATTVAVPTSVFLIEKNKNGINDPYDIQTFSNIDGDKIFNFNFQDKYRHTFMVVR